LIGIVLAISFTITFAFSAIPVIAPLLGALFFGIGAVEMAYLFMYIGVIQSVSQGLLIGKITQKFREEQLIACGSLTLALGMLLMPLLPNLTAYLISITIISVSIGILNIVVSSFISKRTSANEQGVVLGAAQSISSIARVPGPLVAGAVFEFAGSLAPFLLSVILLLIAFGLSCKILHAGTISRNVEKR
jgi:DHA1 family tetracycline resistance protein-like MFS transporter